MVGELLPLVRWGWEFELGELADFELAELAELAESDLNSESAETDE